MELIKCTAADVETLAELNRQLIEDEKSDNPMSLFELEVRMRGFVNNGYDAYFFCEENDIMGYALVDRRRAPLYLRQFFIAREYRRKHKGKTAFSLLLKELDTDEIDLDVLSHNEAGCRFWESCGFSERVKCMRLTDSIK